MITTAAQRILNNASKSESEFNGRDPRSSIPEEYWELLDQHRAELTGQAAGILGNRDDAEDVVQKTFCEAFSDAKRIPQEGSIGQWLRMINRRNALDRARENVRSARDSRRTSLERDFTTGGFSNLEARDAVRKAIQSLPAELRAVVDLRYFQHRSSKEIAEALKIPLSTIKRQLFQANVLLHATLKSQFKSGPQPHVPDQQGRADDTETQDTQETGSQP
jgi:RNA polymerase sigma-70 factor (ECF subfamily)